MQPFLLANPFPGAGSFRVPTTTSTQDEARRLVAMGLPRGTCVTADVQTAGRGRLPERRWEAEPGTSLLVTIILDSGEGRLPGFTLRMGLALCRALELFTLQGGRVPPESPRLKWPNDAYLLGRKVGGILCEASPEATYVGMGVNVGQRSLPAGLEGKATSLALVLGLGPGEGLERDRLLEILLDQVRLVLEDDSWLQAAEALLWGLGGPATFLVGLPERGEALEGTIVGLSPEGALRLRPREGGPVRELVSGELLVGEGIGGVDRTRADHIR